LVSIFSPSFDQLKFFLGGQHFTPPSNCHEDLGH
jgi:hypothetical protein